MEEERTHGTGVTPVVVVTDAGDGVGGQVLLVVIVVGRARDGICSSKSVTGSCESNLKVPLGFFQEEVTNGSLDSTGNVVRCWSGCATANDVCVVMDQLVVLMLTFCLTLTTQLCSWMKLV